MRSSVSYKNSGQFFLRNKGPPHNYWCIERFCLSLYVYCEQLLKANIDNSTHYSQNSFLNRLAGKNCENSPAPLLHKHKELTKCFSTRKKNGNSKLYVHCNPVQGQYRARTGFSMCSFSLWEKLHRVNPVFITGMGLQCKLYALLCRYLKWKNLEVLKSDSNKSFLGHQMS